MQSIHNQMKEVVGGDRLAIVGWTIVFKVVTIPLYIASAKTKRKLHNATSLMKSMNATVTPNQLKIKWIKENNGKPFTLSQIQSQFGLDYRNAKQFINDRHGLKNPLRTLLLPLWQVPPWLYASISLRKMSGMTTLLIPNVINDLISIEPQLWDLNSTGFWSLSLYIGLAHSYNSFLFPAPNKLLKTVLHTLSILSIPIAYLLPESVVIFWCTSTTWTLLQNILFEMPIMDKWIGKKKSIKFK